MLYYLKVSNKYNLNLGGCFFLGSAYLLDNYLGIDVELHKVGGYPKDSRAKPLYEITPNKRCSFHQSNKAPKPMNHSYSQIPRLTNENKT
jgi:hypothetical protein